MIKQLTDWLDDRSGFKSLIKRFRDEPIPGGARWRYVFGSALTVAFLIQAFTGVLLMTAYSPSSSMAWASVFYIKEQLWMGWFIRGVHHFSAQTLMTLLPFHLLQVVWSGAYRRPRELTWWFGLILLFLSAAFSLTGYLLPWDQKGYWHARVATNIMGSAPVIGPYFLRVLIGGADYGNLTVTHFYGLHVAILPTLFVLCVVAHIMLTRRYGITPPPRAERWPSARYWPDQHVRNTVFSAAMVGVIVALVLIEGGTTLDAPADPSSSDYPARPEWYFLSLFQMLKMFPGRIEVVGTFVIPSCLALLLASLPFWDRVLPGKLAHILARGFVFTVVGCASVLIVQALYADAHDASFQASRKKADAARQRAIYLAGLPEVGIPPDGSGYLLRRDPLTQGRNVLERRCLGCHVFEGKGKWRANSVRPCPFRLACVGSRLAREAGVADLFREGGRVRRHGRMEEELQAYRQGTGRRGRFRRLVRRHSRRFDHRRLGQRPGRVRPSGSRAVSEGVRQVPRHRWLYRRRFARCPRSLWLGISLVDRPDDPQTAVVGQVRLPRGKAAKPDAGVWARTRSWRATSTRWCDTSRTTTPSPQCTTRRTENGIRVPDHGAAGNDAPQSAHGTTAELGSARP